MSKGRLSLEVCGKKKEYAVRDTSLDSTYLLKSKVSIQQIEGNREGKSQLHLACLLACSFPHQVEESIYHVTGRLAPFIMSYTTLESSDSDQKPPKLRKEFVYDTHKTYCFPLFLVLLFSSLLIFVSSRGPDRVSPKLVIIVLTICNRIAHM
ncbi:uncharacterized protein F4822DRAFT_276228 [Hypoxylon trugodes]|uniref:uncharacterized protein n=1 Tax=Hypoxylon trugodes TaxID=326681 RepID=UPI002198B592|nr:uncharacterized protein F4822DRAFT_276228 [Hypoxylon trugodes]KAI1387189.1 hypothetical protein F4822DRAFT_276228 [Hypoxylon trugodes]